MRKVVAGLAISLDGVVETPHKWMNFTSEMAEEIAEGVAQADAILLGRRTYLDFAAMWPTLDSGMAGFMNNTPKYVFSSTMESAGWANSTLFPGDLAKEVARLKELPGKNIQIPGSPRVVRSLLRDGLLDELSMMISPIVLGSGARLFDDIGEELKLDLVESRALANGVISVTYRPP
jgi:dihydrofolate reductase